MINSFDYSCPDCISVSLIRQSGQALVDVQVPCEEAPPVRILCYDGQHPRVAVTAEGYFICSCACPRDTPLSQCATNSRTKAPLWDRRQFTVVQPRLYWPSSSSK